MTSKYKILNRDVIKYLAVLTMLLNHISTIFLQSGSLVAEVFLDLGYFTAITMCYFLVEGFRYTRSKRNYFVRLLLFALLSQIPYSLAFTQNGMIEFQNLNMLFTLLICFGILMVVERVADKGLKIVYILLLLFASTICDWAVLAPVFTLLFIWSQGSKKREKLAFLFAMLLFGAFNFLGGLGRFSFKTNGIYALGSMLGIALAGIVLVEFYNGKRMQRGKVFSKWFFYLFYPVHLLLLGVIRIFC